MRDNGQLESIFQYRLLLSKTVLRMRLCPAEQLRLERLRGQLSVSIPGLDDTAADLGAALDAEFACGGRFRPARVRSLSGGGLVLGTDAPPRSGKHLLVHIWDPGHSIEYSFPTRVMSSTHGARAGMQVAFEGLPAKLLLMTRGRRARVEDAGAIGTAKR